MYTIKNFSYVLEVDGGRIGAVIDGCTVADLDVRSAVNKTNDNNETVLDVEPDIPVLTNVSEKNGNTVFTWKNSSSLWEEKTYTLECTPLRFIYNVSVKGEGRVDSVQYFIGCTEDKNLGSKYEFNKCFYPLIPWDDSKTYFFKAVESRNLWSVLMVPPMFFYSFICEGIKRQLALGLVAERGEHNFHTFSYNHHYGDFPNTSFHLETDQAGHTSVNGTWTAPAVVGYGAEDELDAARKYSDYYFNTGIATPRKNQIPPKFWNGPMACGWIEQAARKDEIGKAWEHCAIEQVYEDYVQRLHDAELYPRCLIIDDKWATKYATNIVDTSKFPDLRAFVERRHAEGIHTMLWFKTFDSDGFECDEACVINEKGERKVDPSHPEYIKVLEDALHRILSADEGCYNCDGIKIDFAMDLPKGRNFKTYSGKYGVELLYDYIERIYTLAKSIKPEAIINFSPCHPYFAHICDQGRLHDYNASNRNCPEDMEMRAKLFRIAMPGILIDTDNAAFNTKRDTMRWLLNQHHTGIPDLYCISPLPSMSFTKEDLKAISLVWKEYTERIDAMYGDN